DEERNLCVRLELERLERSQQRALRAVLVAGCGVGVIERDLRRRTKREHQMKTETIEYKDGSLTLRGYLAYDDQKAGKRPGVLVMPEAFGLGKNAKSRA